MPATPSRTIDDSRTADRQETRRLERPSRGRLTADGPLSIDLNQVQRGMVMEWKRHSIYGQPDDHNQVIVQQNHWKPVPHKLQPHVYGHLCKDDERHIIVKGLGLYMRPEYLNEDARAEHEAETSDVLGNQLQSLRLSSKEQVGDRYTRIKKSTIAVQAVE